MCFFNICENTKKSIKITITPYFLVHLFKGFFINDGLEILGVKKEIGQRVS